MRKKFEPLMEYKNQGLMDELNEFMVAVKVWMLPIKELQGRTNKPTVSEIDQIQQKLNEVLRRDATPCKYYNKMD